VAGSGDHQAPVDATLGRSSAPLTECYDLAMLDLDGVVYVGRRAVPFAAEAVTAAAGDGMRCAFITNNASRPPEEVATHLRQLGIGASPADVVTSAQAAARMLVDLVGGGATVYVIGGAGLTSALAERELVGTQSFEDDPKAVVTGYHPDTRWRTVIDGALLVREGLPWVATNTDMSVPTPRGPGPGNGVLVAAIAEYAGRRPEVAGKPEPPLIRETVARLGAARPLMVGDRLDTDIAGARRTGHDSLLVMTGVTDLDDLVAAPPELRPTYIGADLRALFEPHASPSLRDDHRVEAGGWTARVEHGRLVVEGEGEAGDWWRAAASCAWRHLDSEGTALEVATTSPPG
jgi:glycerol-1-phosphatase